uniref:Remorin_C domain-containing protein n=1 Tax=Caenorhabditis tropicalis TaxID=1561998 RepID=A0A1I7USH5_9PELO
MTDETVEIQTTTTHVARRSKLDELLQSVATGGATLRSNSWSREQQADMEAHQLTQSARSPRSKSMNRPRVKEFEEDDKEKRDNAEAAFREWLKRKAAEPKTPRASPSREAISKHLKDEARQRVMNQWHNNKRFAAKIEAYVNGSSSPPKSDGNQTL